MKRRVLLFLCCLFAFGARLIAQDIGGFWNTIDDETGKPRSIVAIYEYHGKWYGRIIATYDESEKVIETIDDPKTRAPGVVGNPYYCGIDFIWNLKKSGSKFKGGEILDPEKGKIYGAELWTRNGKLIVRGKILFFGKNQTWLRAVDSDFPKGFKKPNLTQLVPVIPEVN